MTDITWSNYVDWMRDNVATGYISGFSVANLGLLNLDTTITAYNGLTGQSATMQPKGRLITSSRIADGLVYRADGTVFNPWGLAGERAPAAYPQHTQSFIYTGHAAAVMQQYEFLLGRVGYTGNLYFSYGRVAGNSFGAKYCPAMLLTVSTNAERVLNTTSSPQTILEFTATWQQTGAFTY